MELDKGNSKEYKDKAIYESAVYASKSKGHILDLYYLVLWKGYPGKENNFGGTTSL